MPKTTRSLADLLADRKALEEQLAATPKAELIAAAASVLERLELKAAAKELAPIAACLPAGDPDRQVLQSIIRILTAGAGLLGAEERRAQRKAAPMARP